MITRRRPPLEAPGRARPAGPSGSGAGDAPAAGAAGAAARAPRRRPAAVRLLLGLLRLRLLGRRALAVGLGRGPGRGLRGRRGLRLLGRGAVAAAVEHAQDGLLVDGGSRRLDVQACVLELGEQGLGRHPLLLCDFVHALLRHQPVHSRSSEGTRIRAVTRTAVPPRPRPVQPRPAAARTLPARRPPRRRARPPARPGRRPRPRRSPRPPARPPPRAAAARRCARDPRLDRSRCWPAPGGSPGRSSASRGAAAFGQRRPLASMAAQRPEDSSSS